MNTDTIARLTLARLNCGSLSDRLYLFLADPTSVNSPGYRRVTELLDTARQRREAAQHAGR